MKTPAFFITLAVGSALAAATPNFEKDIRPILKAHCFHCHGEDGEKKGGVDLRLVRLMDKTGAIDKEAPHESVLLEMVKSGEMPKEAKPLPPHEIELIEAWLKAGAPTLRPEPEKLSAHVITEEERAHWSFQPVQKPAVPDNGEANPIDAFVKAKLVEQGLDFAPKADRTTRLRRASFDLLGLPPTPEEVRRFDDDQEPDAWSRALDRLLASPHYGERWGRHWLDVAGYADSNGGGKDSIREHAWHYRDYVVKSFNADKPWDVFIKEQFAGDELARFTHERAGEILKDTAQWDRLAATGFLRMAPDATEDDPPDPAVAQETVIAENLKVVGSSLLGLSVGCAQCHDHRFDPISQVDYFRLRALIEPVFNREDWRGPSKRQYAAYTPAEKAANDEIEVKAKAVDKKRTDLIDREYAKYLEERLKPVPEEARDSVRKAWLTKPEKRTDEQKELLKKHNCDFEKADHLRFLDGRDEEEKQRSDMVKEAARIRDTKLSRVIMAASEIRDVVPATRRFHRGDYRQPKEAVPPGELSLFDQAPAIPEADPDQYSSGRRLAYAKWLTSGQHPLVARVLVNRFWFHHFGRGLVANLADFGMRTERPVQAELLDWLASDFVENGWQLKAWHKRVMMSRTYQQGSRNPEAEARDAENVFLARTSLKRLEAETVRDSLLAVARNLKSGIGGKPLRVARRPEGGIVLGKEVTNDNNDVVKEVIALGDDANRRSLYVQYRRNLPLTVLQTFDMPHMSPNCSQRAVTTVAPQSLMMLNDTFVIEQSKVLAQRILDQHPEDDAQQVRGIWQAAYQAEPTGDEVTAAVALIQDEIPRQREKGADEKESRIRALSALCQIVFASNRFLYAP
jgi:cytochrome c553